MKQITTFLLFIFLLGGCQSDRKANDTAKYDPIKAHQDFQLAYDQIKNNDPYGLLKLYEIETESLSAEDSEIAAEQLRGYLYSKTELWVRAFAKVDFTKFREEFESTDFDIYRFTPEGELPVAVVAKKVVQKLKKMKGKNQQEQVLIDYLITYYGNYLKSEKQTQ
jgi:hypothetical protein